MEELQGTTAPSNSNQEFQARWHTSAECSAFLLFTEEARPLSLDILCCLDSFWGTTSPSLAPFFLFLFFFKSGRGCKLSAGGGGRGRGRVGKGWDPRASLDDDPLFLSARSSLRPVFLFRAISSSSSELSSMRATRRLEVRTPEILSGSSPKSEA